MKYYFYDGNICDLLPNHEDRHSVTIHPVNKAGENFLRKTGEAPSRFGSIVIESHNEEWLTYLTLLGKVPHYLIPIKGVEPTILGFRIDSYESMGKINDRLNFLEMRAMFAISNAYDVKNLYPVLLNTRIVP